MSNEHASAESEGTATPPRRAASVPIVAGSVTEMGFVRRTRALLRTAPLHRLAQATSWQDWDSAPYDPRVLSLAAIDAVIARMGFATELSYEDVVVVVAELARIAAPNQPEDEHLKVAAYVLDGLLNNRDRNDSQQFSVSYSDYTDGHSRRELRFFLLVERARPDGQIVLEASADAVNVFRGGLNLRVEDAQMAMELVLQAQLERGDLDEAEVTAEQNQRLSYEMSAQIRALLDATRSDVRRVDWKGEMLNRLDRARDHVGQRIMVEGQILAHLSSGDEVREGDVKEKAQRVASLLEVCLREHRRLHERLMGASSVFLSEQQRQELRFRGHGLGLFSCTDQLLAPVLELGAAAAEDVTTTFAQTVLGPRSPRLPRLSDLIPMLLHRRTPGVGDRDDDDEPDLSDSDDDVEAYDPTILDAAALVVAPTRERQVRLSELLKQARAWDPEVEELVRLSVLWSFAPEYDDDELAGAVVDLIDPDVIVIATGNLLETQRWTGDDLLVGPATLLLDDDDDGAVLEKPVHDADESSPEIEETELVL
jgi:hypothetical protein